MSPPEAGLAGRSPGRNFTDVKRWIGLEGIDVWEADSDPQSVGGSDPLRHATSPEEPYYLLGAVRQP